MYRLSFSLLVCFLGCVNNIWSAETSNNKLNVLYHVSSDAQNWYQALIMCKNAGMELASIRSKDENENLSAFLNKNGYYKGYWLSGTSLGNGHFYWVSTGTSVIYTKWLPNQPDNAKLADNYNKGEHCIQWGIYNQSVDSAWNDLGCNNRLHYICQEYEYCH